MRNQQTSRWGSFASCQKSMQLEHGTRPRARVDVTSTWLGCLPLHRNPKVAWHGRHWHGRHGPTTAREAHSSAPAEPATPRPLPRLLCLLPPLVAARAVAGECFQGQATASRPGQAGRGGEKSADPTAQISDDVVALLHDELHQQQRQTELLDRARSRGGALGSCSGKCLPQVLLHG